jgi:hypothetical protein
VPARAAVDPAAIDVGLVVGREVGDLGLRGLARVVTHLAVVAELLEVLLVASLGSGSD